MVTKSSTNQRTPQILKAAYISHKIALSMMNVFHISPQVTHFYYQKIQILISAFDAQGSRGIIVPVQVGAVKIYLCSSSGGGAQEK